MKKIIFLILLLIIPIRIHAKNITNNTNITVDNTPHSELTDNEEKTFITINKKSNITINSKENIYGIYIIYELKSGHGKLTSGSKNIKVGSNDFLHEYIDIKNSAEISKNIKIQYQEDVKIAEIYVFTSEDTPDFVEKWDTPPEEADLVLFSTHSDDEQLFFAGLIPTYVARGAKVEVVYFTMHYNNPQRLHEILHGLYTVGVRNYPIIGFVPDKRSYNLEEAIKYMNESKISEKKAIDFYVEILRRFKPSVVVTHDENGEYGHGQHMLSTYILEKALELSNKPSYHKESKKKYGLWNVPKTYIHLYDKNQIVMDYDTPLEFYDNKTAYEVAKIGFSKHLSQQSTSFPKWLTGVDSKGEGVEYTKASEIKEYSPCQFGLYRSLVGTDKEKNDMFENMLFKSDPNYKSYNNPTNVNYLKKVYKFVYSYIKFIIKIF